MTSISVRARLVWAVVPALCLLLASSALDAQSGSAIARLRIGSSNTLSGGMSAAQEQSALKTLQAFIKEETGLDNDIAHQEDWRQLADKLAAGDLHLGVFQGYEFAWAQDKHAKLKPLALAVNVYRYPVGFIVVNKSNPAKDFAGLKGNALAIPPMTPRVMQRFIDRECQALGEKTETFFAKVTTNDSIEDALDDVVDGMKQAAAVDLAALEAFKRSKPGRYKKLQTVAQTQPFPPPVIAYYGSVLDEAARNRFQKGLLDAKRKEKGETMLTLFRLTGFEGVPEDFDKILAETRKLYPPPPIK
jgi:ABC-type phosphate/phosphonate transport system substrate-binding protein